MEGEGAGKGDTPRPCDKKIWDKNFDQIIWDKTEEEKACLREGKLDVSV